MTAAMPSSVTVGAHVYTVHDGEDDWAKLCRNDADAAGDTLMGRAHHMTGEIFIRPGMSEANRRDTLLHEVMHAVFAVGLGDNLTRAKDDDTEEYLCSGLTPWLLLVIRANPDLITYLKG